MAEHLHRHRPVQQHPAAQERQHRTERQVDAESVAVLDQLVAQPSVDLVRLEHTEPGFLPQLEVQREEGAGELQRALFREVVPAVVFDLG